MAVLVAFAPRGEWRRIQVVTHPEQVPPWFGLPLPGVYVAWVAVVALLYAPCRGMDRLKSSRPERWWRYL